MNSSLFNLVLSGTYRSIHGENVRICIFFDDLLVKLSISLHLDGIQGAQSITVSPSVYRNPVTL